MAKKVYGFESKREFDRMDRAVQRVERMEARPKKGKRPPRGRGGGSDLPFQLAVVTVATQEPAYTGSGLTFQIDNTPPDGKAILLNTALADSDPFVVDTTAGSTLAALEFNFYNAHRDVPIGVGDVIRVWKRTGELVEAGETGGLPIIYGEHYNVTDYLRRLGGYSAAPAEPLVLTSFDDVMTWGEGLVGPEGPIGPQGPAGTPGPAVSEGYGIDVEGTDPRTVHNDPTEWTGMAAAFQFFAHLAADTARTDPAWKTVADYDATKNQMWWHQSGAWKAETTTDYGGAAGTPQFLLNWGAGNGGEWQWKSAINYDTAKDQIPWSDNGSWKWEEANKLTAIKIPTSIEINLTGTSPNQVVEVKLNYTEYTLFGVAGNTGNMSDTLETDEC